MPRTTRIAFAVTIGAVASFMAFANLDRALLWQDEAQTALLARTALRHGIPIGFDGANSLSQEAGNDIDRNGVFRYHPWLQFYIAAASFALFGESTIAARAPFAALGVATILLTYYTALRLWRSTSAAVMAASFLTFSVPFLLLIRQCRYYSPLAFFLLLSVFAYLQILRGRKAYVALFAVAAVAAMHSFHVLALVFLATAALHTLIWHRGRWKWVLLPAGAIVLAHIPWFMWVLAVANYRHPQSGEKILHSITAFSTSALWYIVTPPVILAYVILYVVARRSKAGPPMLEPDQRSAVTFMAMLMATTILVIAATAPAVFFRYLSPLPPLAALLFAPTVPLLVSRRRLIAAAIVAVSTMACYVTVERLADYRYELFASYRGPIRGIVEFLNANGKPGDLVLVPYGDMPLKFYTNLRIVGGLTGESLEQARGARFLVTRRTTPSPLSAHVDRFLVSIADPALYDKVVLDCPDYPFETREDVTKHYFHQHWPTQPVLVFQRRE